MSENPRDTQFAGFAALLWEEIRDTQRQQIDNLYDGLVHTTAQWDEETMQLIARRAHDLVKHTCEEVEALESDCRWTSEGLLREIPDLTAWPDAPAPSALATQEVTCTCAQCGATYTGLITGTAGWLGYRTPGQPERAFCSVVHYNHWIGEHPDG